MVDSKNIVVFIFQYAWKDLLPIHISAETFSEKLRNLLRSFLSCLPALLNVVSVAMLIIASVIIGGIWFGSKATFRELLIENPLVSRINVFCDANSRVTTITPQKLAELKSLRYIEGVGVKKANSTDQIDNTENEGQPVVTGVYGWYSASLLFFNADGSYADYYTDGRTVQIGDPILEKMVLLPPGRKFASENDVGVIISVGQLRTLGYISREELEQILKEIRETGHKRLPTIQVPESLQVNYKLKKADIPLLGIATWVPDGEFLMTEGFHKSYLDNRWNPDPIHDHAYLGPIPLDQKDTIIASLKTYLDGLKVSYKVIERVGTEKWLKLTLPEGKAWVRSYFENAIFPVISQQLQRAGVEAQLKLDFDAPLRDPQDTPFQPIKLEYINASLYVKNIDLIPETYNAVKELGLSADRRVVQDLQWMEQIAKFGGGIFFAVIVVVALISSINLYLTFTQAIQRKIPEIGILMAFGSSKILITIIYLTEAIIIWLSACLWGISVSLVVGNNAEAFLISTFKLKEGLDIFRTPLILNVSVIGFAFLICVLSTFIASLFATRIQPAQAVRLK